jgi:hypothetical protein
MIGRGDDDGVAFVLQQLAIVLVERRLAAGLQIGGFKIGLVNVGDGGDFTIFMRKPSGLVARLPTPMKPSLQLVLAKCEPRRTWRPGFQRRRRFASFGGRCSGHLAPSTLGRCWSSCNRMASHQANGSARRRVDSPNHSIESLVGSRELVSPYPDQRLRFELADDCDNLEADIRRVAPADTPGLGRKAIRPRPDRGLFNTDRRINRQNAEATIDMPWLRANVSQIDSPSALVSA